MKEESLNAVFYVSANGDIYFPLPRDRALVPDVSNKQRPGLYSLRLYDNPMLPKRDKDYVLKVFFAKTNIEAFFLPRELEKKGSVSAGPYTRDVAESKIGEIAQYERAAGCGFKVVLEKA